MSFDIISELRLSSITSNITNNIVEPLSNNENRVNRCDKKHDQNAKTRSQLIYVGVDVTIVYFL